MISRLSLPFRLLLVIVTAFAATPVRAASCVDASCVEIGGRLASVDSKRSFLLNTLLGGLLGSSISLQIVDWQALTSTQINLLDLLQAVQAQASLGTPQEALDTSVDAVKVFNATAAALQAKGNTVAANAVLAIAARIGPGYIRLGDLIDACASCVSYADTSLNALDLVTGEVSLFNFTNMVYTPNPLTISGSALGLGALGTIQLYAQVLQKPVIICRTSGAYFYGAGIRLKLDVALPTVSLTAALAARLAATNTTLNVNVANVQAQLTHLSLFATIAQAQGMLQTVDAVGQVVTLQATPGLVDIYVGTIDDSVFFTHSAIHLPTDLTYGTVGSLQLSILGFPITASILAKGSAIGAAPFYQSLTFSGSFPQQQTVSSSSLSISNLVTSLINSLDINIQVTGGLTGLGALDSTVNSILSGVLTTLKAPLIFVYQVALNPLVTSLLTDVVDPALFLLGVQIGEAYVTVFGARRRCTYTVSGAVYRDTNRNGFLDGTESGTGLPLFAKLVSETTPNGPALQTVTINSTTGAYSFTGVSSGMYRIVIDDNATPSDVTPASIATGWTATEQPTLLRIGVAVTSDLPAQNFGLANVTTVAGRVFHDTGTGGGTANDGTRNGTEAGVGGLTLKLIDSGNAVLDTTTTAADGTYRLFIPGTVTAGAALRVLETNFPNDLSTGASVGTTGGTYQRATDEVSFAFTTGTSYTGVDFGDVPPAQLTTDGQQTALAGTTVYYPHRFIAGSGGSVTFSMTHTLEPAVDGWTEVIFLDSNGNGQLDFGEPVLTGATTVTEGQVINLIVKIFVPTTATYGGRAQAVLHADVTYTGAYPALTQSLTHTDLTITGASGTAGLALTKTVDKASAKPGDNLTYTITFINESPATLRNIVISDATPSFTRFVSAAVGSTPTALGTATIANPGAGAAGTLRWTFSGDLASGATGTVTFIVQVEQ